MPCESVLISLPDSPTVFCGPVDGCSPPLPCDISLQEFLCSLRNLLPPGEIWSRNVEAQDIAYNCGSTGQGVGCPLPEGSEYRDQSSALVGILDSLGAALFQTFCRICEIGKETDPCLATVSVSDKFEALGLSECLAYDLCNQCLRVLSEEDRFAVKQLLICFFEKLSYGLPLTDEVLRSLFGLFGVSPKFISVGDINCTDLSDLYICPRSEDVYVSADTSSSSVFSLTESCFYPLDCDGDLSFFETGSFSGCGSLSDQCGYVLGCSVECEDLSPEYILRLCTAPAILQQESCLSSVRAQIPTSPIYNPFSVGCTAVNKPLSQNIYMGLITCLSEKLLPPRMRRNILIDCCDECEEVV